MTGHVFPVGGGYLSHVNQMRRVIPLLPLSSSGQNLPLRNDNFCHLYVGNTIFCIYFVFISYENKRL